MESCSPKEYHPNGDEDNYYSKEDIHPHCLECIKLWRCTVRPRPGESCEIITCDLECGARFHACKKSEHHLLCGNEKVPCINAVSGCPALMQRKYLGSHLETCPASVVHCTMEWNRWPIHIQDHHLIRQCHQQVLHQAQLDVALALRDQRMLRQWWLTPRRSRCSLRNSLTRKYPAVPLAPYRGLHEVENNTQDSSSHSSRTLSDDESDTPWEMRKAPPGLQRSVCGELYRASRQATESLSAALSVIANHSINRNSSEIPFEPLESYYLSTDHLADRIDFEENKENINRDYKNSLNKTKSEACFVLPDNEAPHILNGFGLESKDLCTVSSSGCTVGSENVDFNFQDILDMKNEYDVLFVNDTIVSEISSASMIDHARKDVNPPIALPHPLSFVSSAPMAISSTPPWCGMLGLDLNLESITRYQIKPKSMYTFLCAQEFRRDEYAWHYKNVHSEIHGGLNGWLEQRCPLAQYGCMFARRRFYPEPKGSTIVHNDILESFGVQPPLQPHPWGMQQNQDGKQSKRSPARLEKSYSQTGSMEVIYENDDNSFGDMKATIVSITQLPFEILQYIARFLDSFSMCNLSLTSRLMRDVCCSLLEERGIVVFQWERRRIAGKYCWRVAYKRWFFSTSFTPIQQWCFEDSNNMSNHLASCVYFHRNIRTDPYFLPGATPNDDVYQKLKEGIVEASRGAFENITTKL